MSAASPGDGDRQAGQEEKEAEDYVEEMFTRVFEESAEDTLET